MPPRGFLGDEALRRILRAQIAHVHLDKRIALFKKFAMVLGILTAPGMDEIELPLLARALFDSFFPLFGGELGQSCVELLRRRLGR